MKRNGSVFSCKLLFVIFVCLACAGSIDAQLTYTFSNTTPVVIPGTGTGPAAGSPYPSIINVTNVPSVVSKVTVKLTGLSHTFPGDIDMLLVGPGGQNALIMSDVGGGDDVVNINLILDDASPVSMPANGLTGGTFKPTNITAGDTLPGAPVPAGGSALSVFNGTPANGAWSLYIYDDAGIDVGRLNLGWELTIVNAISGENPNAISIPGSGAATPYPSELPIANHEGLVADVQVNLNNFSHASPDDVDLMLVSPSGRRVILMSDVGGANPVSNVTLTFDDGAAASLPDSGQIVSGIFKPTNFEPGDAFPAPAPAITTGNLLSIFNGDQANGNWQLYLVDDNGDNAGTVSGGWSIAIQMSPSVIAIPESGAASPYPSEKIITGRAGNVTRVTVTLTNFSHLSPDDVDIMLVAPNGRRIVLMSDVGGNIETGGLNLVFDDTAASNLPDDSALSSGTFKPTDFEPGDVFPAPAPATVTGSTLGHFYGGAPNGVWKLYIVDDSGSNFGSIAGNWSLTLESSTSACVFTIFPTMQSFPITGGSGSFAINMPSGCSWAASTGADFITIDSPAAGDGNGMLSYSVAPNFSGGRAASIDVSNGVLVRTFQVQQPSGCPFSLSAAGVAVGSAGGARSVDVTAGGVCTWQAQSSANWIQITSGEQTGNGAATFNVSPNTSPSARSATVTVGARTFEVNQAGAVARKFDFDGDGSSDISVYRPSSGTWYILNSGTPGSYAAINFGLETDRIAPADFDGDRKFDVAVYRDGTWYIFNSQTETVRTESWGLAADMPVPGDYDGDGRADLAVYRAGDTTWYIRRSIDGVFQSTVFGSGTDKPVPADYDGDGKLDLALYQVGNVHSFWSIKNSSSGQTVQQQFGNANDIAVPGDFDGDGRDNMVVFRPSNGTWYTSLDPGTNYGARQWGVNGDTPAAGDFNGDGRADYAVFRAGVWWILHSNNSTTRTETWGLNTDRVVPAAYNAE